MNEPIRDSDPAYDPLPPCDACHHDWDDHHTEPEYVLQEESNLGDDQILRGVSFTITVCYGGPRLQCDCEEYILPDNIVNRADQVAELRAEMREWMRNE